MLRIDIESDNNMLIVRLKGKMLKKKNYKLEQYIVPLILKHNIKAVVCNFSKVERIDETGINTLFKIKWVLKLNKGKLYVCELPENLSFIKERLKVKSYKNELSVNDLVKI